MHREDKRGVYGPYYEKERERWKVVVDPGTSHEAVTHCRTEEEGLALVEETRQQRQRSTLAKDLRDEYLTWLHRKRGRKAHSIDTTLHALNRYLGEKLEDPVSHLTARRCQMLYDALTEKLTARGKPYSVDTHRNSLKEFRSFCVWLVKRGYLPKDPTVDIEGEGRKRYGKPQLRVDEARTWMRTALEMWQKEKNAGALAALTALLLGIRVSELLNRKVRDLDDGGKLFWVGDLDADDTKTKASRRRLEVPEILQEPLKEVTRGKASEDPLWPYHSDQWILRTVKLICERAGVPKVVTHSLRGIHATLAEAAGVTSHLVASALGHTSSQVTHQHYTSKEAQGAAKQSRALAVLEGGGSSRPAVPSKKVATDLGHQGSEAVQEHYKSAP